MVLSKTGSSRQAEVTGMAYSLFDIASNGLDHEWIMPQNQYENLGDMDGHGTHRKLVGLLEGRLYKNIYITVSFNRPAHITAESILANISNDSHQFCRTCPYKLTSNPHKNTIHL